MDSSFMWHPIMSGMRTRPMNNEAMGGASDVRSSAIRSPTSRSTWSACRRFLNPSSTTCRTVCLVTTVVSESAATTAKRPASTLRYSIKKIASSCWIPAVSGCRKLPISRAWDGMRNIRVFAVGHNCRTETPEITLYFLNTHFDHVGKQARKESACMIVKWIRRHSDCGETILVGDFNVDQRSESYRELVKTGFLTDSFEAAPIRMAATGTVNGFDPQRWTGQRIDHVLVTRGIEVLRYGLLTNPYWSVDCAGNREARLPSDHYPVSVYLTIP